MQINAIDGFEESLENLRNALRASGVVGTWDWAIPAQRVRLDQGAAEYLAGDPDLAEKALTRDEALAAVHPADQGWLKDEIAASGVSAELVFAEFRVISPEHGTRWVLGRGRIYRDAAGSPERAHGILIDITESRESGCVAGASEAHHGDPLHQAAELCLGARERIVASGSAGLLLLMDTLLLELGRTIARDAFQG